MGSIDANGIYKFAEADTNATFSGLLNIGQDATSAALGALAAATDSRLRTLEDADTGWVELPATAGNVSRATLRVKSRVLYIRGAIATVTGTWPDGVSNLARIPTAYLPTAISVENSQATGTGQGAAGVPNALQLWITPSGLVQMYTPVTTMTTAMVSALSGHPL